ncbi:MAG: flippase-like domain-containing protein, partial [Actinobacteria bacterium]|nr:flippase-like domain-containing protein [Actinomycetota bacterium]
MKRGIRIFATLVFTTLALAYILWKIDLDRTVDVLLDASPWWFALAAGIMIGTALPMALRWQWMLAAQGMPERFAWLTRAYFVSYAAGQILPTAIGGDAVRVVETARRHPGRTADVTAIVLLERGLGGTATVLLGAMVLVLYIWRYDLGAYLWLELLFVLGTFVLAFVFFARAARPLLQLSRPVLTRLRLEKPLRLFYDGVHAFRSHGRVLGAAFALTLALQAVRILAIWASARAVGIDLSPRVF